MSAPFIRLFESPLPLWSYATFTQNITMALAHDLGPDWLGITWSLAIEEQFYLTLPIIIRFVSIRRLPFLLLTLISLTPILRILLLYIPPSSAFPDYVLMPCRADSLLLGVLGAYLVRQKSIAHYFSTHTKLLYIIFGVLLAGTIFLTINSSSLESLAITSYGYSWLALFYLCFLLIAITEKEGPFAWLTSNPRLCRLGILAYGVYMIHQTVNGASHALILNQIPQFQTPLDIIVTIVAFFLTILIAELSWRLFEKRILAIGHSFKYAQVNVGEISHVENNA